MRRSKTTSGNEKTGAPASRVAKGRVAKGGAPASRPPLMMALEPRIMFDGAVAATAHAIQQEHQAHEAHVAAPHATPIEVADHIGDHLPQIHVPTATQLEAPGTAPAVIFVDARVQDPASLLKGVKTGTEIVYLSADSDGLAQIAGYLSHHHEVGSVEIVAHGSDGELLLGNTDVNAGNLSTFTQSLNSIGHNLRAGADILVYACNTAADARGVAFVDALAQDTGHVVAASSNITGFGGDWNLEVTTGKLTALPVLAKAAEAHYAYTLSGTDVATAAQLNTAILAADLDLLGNDTITLTSDITYASAADAVNIAHIGTGTLTIDGGGHTINAAYLSRVLTVTAGNVILENVTIEHGLLAGAGAVSGLQGVSELGAGIYNGGTLTLNNVLITQNVATGGGGGGATGAGGGGGSGAGTGVGANGGGLGAALASGTSGGKGARADAGLGGTASGGGAGGVFGIGIGASGGAGATASSAGVTAGGGGGGAGYLAGSGGGGGNAVGGLYNANGAKLYVIGGSTLTNNLAAAGGGGGGVGALSHGGVGGQGVGGIFNAPTGQVYITGASYAAMTGDVGTDGVTGAATNGASNAGIVAAAAAAKINANSGTEITNYTPVAPVVSSVDVVGASPNNAGSEQFVVTFSESVTGVNVTDFSLHDTGTAAGVITSVTGSGSTYTVLVSPTTGDGTMRLDVTNTLGSIVDAAGNAMSGSYTSGQVYTIDHTDPFATSITTVAVSPNSATSEQFTVNFSENVSGVAASDFTLLNTGTVGGTIASVTAVSGSSYTVTVNNVTGNGTMQLNLNASGTGIVDTAGNPLAGGSPLSDQFYTITHAVPSVTSITTVGSNDNNATSEQFDVTFSEAVTGVNALDFSLHNTGTAGGVFTSVTGSGANYVVTVGGVLGDGTMRLDLNSINTVIDASGDVTTGGYSSGQVYTIDHTPPVATSIVTVGANPNNATTEQYTVNFSEAVTGVTASDFTLVNTGTAQGAITQVTGSGSAYTVTIGNVSGDGTLELNLNASGTGIIDAAGNPILGGAIGQIYAVQHSAPTITSDTTVGANPNNATSEQFDVQFSENVVGVNLADFSLHNTGTAGGIITSITGSGSNYVVSVGSVFGDGTMRLDLNAINTVFDAAGNDTGGGYTNGQVYTLDHTPPVATSIVTVGANPNNASTEQYTVNFSEAVTGVTAGDFTLVNTGTAAGTITSVTGSGSAYTVTIGNVTGDGTLELNLNASGTGITDAVGNPIFGGAIGQIYAVQHSAPTITSDTTVGANPNNATSEQFDVQFSENVVGVNLADFSLHNTGTAVGVITSITGSGSNYVVTVGSVLGDGTMRLDLNTINTVVDAAGNDTGGGYTGGQAYTIEHTPPVATSIATVGANPNHAGTDQYTVTFSEAVTGVDASDFTLVKTGTAQGGITAVTGSGSVYTVTLGNVTGDGTLELNLNATGTGITDAAGNALLVGTLGQVYGVQHSAPTVTSITTVGANPNNATSEQFDVQFSENVVGVDTLDFALANTGTAGGVITSVTGSGSNYVVTVGGVVGDGTMRLDVVPVNTIVDAAGNDLGGGYSGGQTYTLEHTPPVATSIVAASGDTPTATSEQFTVNFSEAVTGVAAGDFTLLKSGTAGGAISSVTGSGSTYTVTVSGTSGVGTLEVNLNAGSSGITDAAGNPVVLGTLGDIYGVTHTLPQVTSITTVGANPSNATSDAFTVTFSENVTGVDVADFSLHDTGTAGGVITSVTGSGNTYTVLVNPVIGDGTMRLDLNAINTVIDSTGNVTGGGYSNGQPYTVDHTPPVATSIVAVGANPTNAGSEQFTVAFSEAVTGVVTGDFSLLKGGTVGGSITQVTGSGSTYTVTVGGLSGDGALQLNLNAGTGITDLAGNAIIGGSLLSPIVQVEHTAPLVTSISAEGSNPSNAGTEKFDVTFSENVSGVNLADFALTDTGSATGVIASVTGSGTSYVVTVGGVIGDGTMRVDFDNNLDVTDAAGTLAANYSGGTPVTLDHTPPIATSISAASGDSATATSDQFDVQFSENVTGVTAGDFTLATSGGVSGTITSVTPVSGSEYTVTVDGVHGTGSIAVILNATGTGIADTAGNGIIGGYLMLSPLSVASVAPSVTSITADGSSPSNASSDQFNVTFSENVTGVDTSDFSLTTTGGVQGTVSSVTQVSGSTYTVGVTGVTGEGTLRLDLNASGTGIKDSSNNAISGGYTGGQTVTVDHTPPTATSITTVGNSTNNATSEQFTVTFSENVQGVTSSDFALGETGDVSATSMSVAQVSGSVYTATVAGVSGDGTLQLNLKAGTGIADTAGNPINGGLTGAIYTIEHTPPAVTSVVTDGANPNNALSDTFTVNFSEGVSGVDASDFTVTPTGTVSGTVTSVTQLTASSYQVTVGGVLGDGTLRLDVNTSGTPILDAAGNALSGGYAAGQQFAVDHTPPIATSITTSSPPSNASSDLYTVTFSEAVTGVSSGDFTLLPTGSAAGSIGAVTQVNGSTYTVAVNNVTGTGTLQLDLNVAGTGITDIAGNPILGGYVTGQLLNVDHTPPTATSITRLGTDPNNAGSDQFAVTFSENVTGVSTADFTLADTGTAAGTIAAVSGSGSSYVVTVNAVTGTGTLGLDLNASASGITDTAGNAISAGFTGQAYTIDHTAPTASSIVPVDTSPNHAVSDEFAVTFSENVNGVTADDFSVAAGGTVQGTILGVTGGGSSYVVTVAGVTGDGTLGVNLNTHGTGITDLTGNAISGGYAGTTVTVEHTPPAVTAIDITGAATTNATSATFAVNFSEGVTGVSTGDFSLATGGGVTGTVSSITGSGTSYLVTVSGITGNGTLGLDLNASGTGIVDAAGNSIALGFSAGQTFDIDHTAPTVTSIATTGASPNNAASDSFAVDFSKNVTGVSAADFALATTGSIAGTVTAVTGSGSAYTVTVTGVTGDGTLGFTLSSAASGIKDTAGNSLDTGYSGGGTYTIEHTPPAVSAITTVGTSPNNAAADDFTVTFTEGVSRVTASDFSLNTGGSVAGTINAVTEVNASTYTVAVNQVSGDGTLGLNLKSSGTGITDAAGNAISGGFNTSQTYTLDHTAPSVASIDIGSASPTNATTETFSVNFSESVSGVTANDFALVYGGSVAGTIESVSGSGSAYVVAVDHVSGNGTLGLDLKASSTGIVDAAGNSLTTGFTGQSYTIDHTAPSVTAIDLVGASPNHATSEQFAVTFSENVTGVAAGDFTLVDTGTAAGTIAAVSGSGAAYVVTVNGVTGDGTMKLNLSASATGITDAAGNTESGGYTAGAAYTIDHTPPAVSSITRVGSAVNNATSEQFTVNFTENVSGVTAADFVLATGGSADGSITSVSGSGSTYTVTVGNASGDGTLRLDLNGNGAGIRDAAGNTIAMGYTSGQSYTLQHTPPAVSSIDVVGAATNDASSEQFAVNFSENVTGVSSGDFALANTGTVAGTIASIAGSASHYIVTVNGVSGSGTMRLDLTGGSGITDAAGNALAAGFSTGESYLLGATVPSVSSITTVGKADNNAASEEFIVNFSEDVTGVSSGDFALRATGTTTGTVASVTGSGSLYTVTVAGVTGDGTLGLDLKGTGTGIVDASGHAIETGFTTGQIYTVEHTPPAVTSIDVVGATRTNAATETFTVRFSEDVTGVDIADFGLARTGTADGTITGVSGSGDTYTIMVTGLSGDGTLRVGLNANTGIQDAAGNAIAGGYGAGEVVTLDHTPPSITSITALGADPNNAGTETFTVQFSEAVDGVTAADFALVTSGTAAGKITAVSGSGSAYTVTVGNVTGDGTIGIHVDPDTHITDTVGNALPAAAADVSGHTTVDHTPPTVTSITTTARSPNNASSEQFTVTFSESVSGVTVGDFTLGATGTAAGKITAVSGSGTTYVVTVSDVSGDGRLQLNMNPSGTGITDQAGNASKSGYDAGQAITVDHTPPSIESVGTPASGSYSSGDTLTFTVTFDEPVTVDTKGGTPELGMTFGSGSTHYAGYVGGSGTNTLTFSYPVGATDSSGGGLKMSGSIALNGGTIADLAGNAGELALNNVGSVSGLKITPVATVPPVVLPPLPTTGQSTAATADGPSPGSAMYAGYGGGGDDGDNDTVALVPSLPWLQDFKSNLPATTAGEFDIGLTSFDHSVAPPNSLTGIVEPVESQFSFTLPISSFQFDPGSIVVVTATLENGNALPRWLSFDASTGRFEGVAPLGLADHLHIVVTARDQNGREVVMPIELTFTEPDAANRTAPQRIGHDPGLLAGRAPLHRAHEPAPVGKESLASQFTRYGRPARERELRALVGHA